MARTLAIEWDRGEIRCLVGRGLGGTALAVDQATSLALSRVDDGRKRTAAEVGQELRSALAQAGIRAAAALVGVSRAAVELRQLSLPPAPDEELPELVRHQASREFTALTDETVLDFVPLGSGDQSQRVVVAAALSEEQLAFVREVCAAAGIKPQRLLLCPYAAGSLLARRHGEGIILLVDPQEDETDLTVLAGGDVLLCRTVRSEKRSAGDDEPANDVAEPSSLIAEIRRTAIAVQNQAGGGTVATIYVCGTAETGQDLVGQLRSELEIPVEWFDPWDGVQAGRSLQAQPPGNPGRFAALLGMLADEAQGRQRGFDFLNPRRRPEPVNRRRLAVMGLAAAAAVALAGLYLAWGQFAEVGDQIHRLQQRSRELDLLVKRGAEKQSAVAAIEEWSLSDVVWLDELRDLSLRFPQPRDAVLLKLTLSARPTGGGNIDLEGLVRDPSIVARMENQLRDEYHEIRTRRVQESVQEKTNTWKFDSVLLVSRRSKDDYLAYFPVESLAEPAAQAGSEGRPESAADEASKTPARRIMRAGLADDPAPRETP